MLATLAVVLWLTPPAAAGEVEPMYGGLLIDGYNYGKDIGPKGSIRFDKDKGAFIGYYTGLKMPKGRRAIFAWAHDTVNQKTRYLGPVGWLKRGASGKNKGNFTVKMPSQFKGGDFGTFEIIGFSAEKTGYLNDKQVLTKPKEPAGSQIQKSLKPAYYLFAKLPNANTELHYCGHGQDFFYAKAPEKQLCYD